MNIEELRLSIETYPQRLYAAMKEVSIACSAIDELEEQIEEEEARLSPAKEEVFKEA